MISGVLRLDRSFYESGLAAVQTVDIIPNGSRRVVDVSRSMAERRDVSSLKALPKSRVLNETSSGNLTEELSNFSVIHNIFDHIVGSEVETEGYS